MTGGDRRRPLWAGPWDEPRSDYDDVIVRVLDEPAEEAPPPPPDREPPGPRPRLALAAAVAAAALLLVLESPRGLVVDDVPSYWGDVPMTCHTVRMEPGDGAAEFFWCRAVGGRPLPPGVYESPESQWTSDLTRRDARQSRVRISRDGEVVGWARY